MMLPNMLIWQDNQKDLENATEQLSEYLERDITSDMLADIKQKVQDKYRLVGLHLRLYHIPSPVCFYVFLQISACIFFRNSSVAVIVPLPLLRAPIVFVYIERRSMNFLQMFSVHAALEQ